MILRVEDRFFVECLLLLKSIVSLEHVYIDQIQDELDFGTMAGLTFRVFWCIANKDMCFFQALPKTLDCGKFQSGKPRQFVAIPFPKLPRFWTSRRRGQETNSESH